MAFWADCKPLAYWPVRNWSRASSISTAEAVRIDRIDKIMRAVSGIHGRRRIFALSKFPLLHLLDWLTIQVSHCKPRYIELATLQEATIPTLLLYIRIDVRINYHYFKDLRSFFPLPSRWNTHLWERSFSGVCFPSVPCFGRDRSGAERESVKFTCIMMSPKV